MQIRSIIIPAGQTVCTGLLILSTLCLLLGCKSGNPFRKSTNLNPSGTSALPAASSVQEIIGTVNQNVMRVDSFSTKDATLSGGGVFNLKGEIAFKRPGYFRLIGSHAVTGQEIDVGRNADVMWMWIGKAEPKAMYYCRNVDYAQCESELNLSMNPMWVIDAMGFGTLDPGASYEGPFPVDEKHFELRTQETSPNGETRTRSIVINREYGLPAAVRIYDRFKTLVADSRVLNYRRDAASGIILPTGVEINCPKENQGKGMKFTILYGTPTLNQLDASNPHLWSMPQYPGYPPTNMAQK